MIHTFFLSMSFCYVSAGLASWFASSALWDWNVNVLCHMSEMKNYFFFYDGKEENSVA